MAGLTAQDYSYRVGSGTPIAELDEHLRGAKAGDDLEFSADHPDPDEAAVDLTVKVKEVKAKVLPDADDAWAAEASEFDTLEELRADLAKRQKMGRRIQGQMAIREKTGASAPPTRRVRTMVIRTIEFAVRSARLGRRVGIAAASAGLKNCPMELKMKVSTSRWLTSWRSGAMKYERGISATTMARPKLAQTIVCLRLWRSAKTPAKGGRMRAGSV